MKKSCLVLYAFLFLLLNLHAQNTHTTIGASAMSMGYAASCLSNEWALFNNVAGLSKINKVTAAFTYEAVPQFSSFNRTAATILVPTKIGVSGLGFYRLGDDLYNEQIISIGFSNQFGIASLGTKCNLIQYFAEGFGTAQAFTISFGGIAEITDHLLVGAHILNINQPVVSKKAKEGVPTFLTIGLGFKISSKLFATAEIEKDLDHEALFKTGLQYSIHKKLIARAGANLNPNAGFAGLEFRARKFNLTYAYEQSFSVGSMHQASVVYQLKKDNE